MSRAQQMGGAVPESLEFERGRVLELLRRYGYNATSFQVLEPDFRYWFDGEEACVAFVDTGKAWVAGGAPICSEPALARVAAGFVAAARAHGRRASFFATEQRFASAADCESILIGEQPVWSPSDWSQALSGSRSLREQLRRARAKGVRTRRIDAAELAPGSPTRTAVEELIRRWLGARDMAPMGFLVRVHPFEFVSERRIFLAERGDKLVGVACSVPVYARSGWFVEDLLRAPDAPNGTTELLVDQAMRDADGLGSGYVTLGLAPLAGSVEGWLAAARRFGKALYDFSGLQAFKAKFAPREWAPIYLSFPREQSSFFAVYDSLVAFSRVGLLRFGIMSFVRGPAIVVRLLALLLVPWTIALSLADSKYWFPMPWVKWAWVAFDVVLGVLLFALTVRWQRRLADVLLAAIACDALLTAFEIVTFNLCHVQRLLDVVVACVAVSAPALASVVLWNTRRREALCGR